MDRDFVLLLAQGGKASNRKVYPLSKDTYNGRIRGLFAKSSTKQDGLERAFLGVAFERDGRSFPFTSRG